MRKKKLFIGCSSEELELAKLAKEELEPTFDVTIWNDTFWETETVPFKINDSILQGLMRATLQFDFGLMIGTSDDKVVSKGKLLSQARDNVLFELGLFIGRMGLSNCAFVIERELDVLTDLKGIILNKFEKTVPESFKEAIVKTRHSFLQQKESTVNFFPSSTLAAVYFENFLFPACRYFIENKGFELDGKRYSKCTLAVIIPKKLSTDLNLQFEMYRNEHRTREVSIESPGRIRRLHLEVERDKDELIFIDFPTVLTGINHALLNLLPDEFNKMDKEYESILGREIERFASTIELLARKKGIEKLIEFKWI